MVHSLDLGSRLAEEQRRGRRYSKVNAEMVAAATRTILAQPDAEAVAVQFERITAILEVEFPDVAAMLADAA